MTNHILHSHSELIRQREAGRTMPGALYGREDVFDNDINVFFHKHWILVGVTADIPEPGDVSTVDIGKASVLIVRDDNEEVKAYRNVCRHRGSRLKEAGKSTVGMLVCPYHQWTYDLDGNLRHTTHMGTHFDHKCRNLLPVHLRLVGSLIFVCMANEAPEDITFMEDTMRERLAPYQLDKCKIAYETEIIENGNWKLVIENNRECYHCAGTHPELTNSFLPEDFGYCPEGLSEESQQALDAYHARNEVCAASWDADGLISNAVEALKTENTTLFRTQRLVIAGAGESQTLDTQVACNRLLGKVLRRDSGDTHLWTHSSWSHVMSDHAVISYIIPLAADKTLVRTKWLVHQDAIEGVDYTVPGLTEVWAATNAQDASLVAINHAGTQDPGYQPGPLSAFTEAYVDQFGQWYTARLQAHGF